MKTNHKSSPAQRRLGFLALIALASAGIALVNMQFGATIISPINGSIISNTIPLTAWVTSSLPIVRIEWMMDGDTNNPIAIWTNPIPPVNLNLKDLVP